MYIHYPCTNLRLNWEEEMRTPSRFAGLTSSEMETPGFGELGERTCGYFYVLWIFAYLITALENMPLRTHFPKKSFRVRYFDVTFPLKQNPSICV